MKSPVSGQAAPLQSKDTRIALDALWRNPLRPETIIGYVNAREADLLAWIDANYVRKEPQA